MGLKGKVAWCMISESRLVDVLQERQAENHISAVVKYYTVLYRISTNIFLLGEGEVISDKDRGDKLTEAQIVDIIL